MSKFKGRGWVLKKLTSWLYCNESQAELDKIYTTAVSGPEEERAAAATVLCGASLTRSWNVQVCM